VKPPSSNGDAKEALISVGDLLKEGQLALDPTSSSSRLDSEVLLMAALGVSRSGLIIALRDPCQASVCQRFRQFIERRQHGEPVAYIINEREFWGLAFEVNPNVLVPRPETELVVEEALKSLAGVPRTETITVLDLGTGSGCIAVSIVSESRKQKFKMIECDALDASAQAIDVAKRNAERHGVGKQINFIHGSWYDENLPLKASYDLIVANPPYIDPCEVTPVELSFEPRSALFSDERGLADTKRILSLALPLLSKRGVLLVEVGAGKRALLNDLVEPYRNCFNISYLGDNSEVDRFCVVRISVKCGGDSLIKPIGHF
jgi:release factor glutamine methyltransferase